MISIVIPLKNERELICRIKNKIADVMEDYDYEIIFVNDGSSDDSWKKIRELSGTDSHIRGISLSRNFGKEAAIMAGLAYTKGDAVITIDADLQHPPDYIPEFIHRWECGARVVEGIKCDRGKEGRVHRFFAHRFYSLMGSAVGKNLNNTSDYKLIDRDVVNVILKMPERQMFYRAITSWAGFKTDTVVFEVKDREFGRTKWSPLKLFMYAVRNITSFTSAPLQIITLFSIVYFILTVVVGGLAFVKWTTGNALQGFTTVILLQLITGGIIMFALGLTGYYISKLCDEVRNRPRYIVEEETGFEDNSGGGINNIKDVLAGFPKCRSALPEAYAHIYDKHFYDNRNGLTNASRVSSKLEGWMHRMVASTAVSGSTLEIGGGSLNQLLYEKNPGKYDVIEPYHKIYENSEFKSLVDNFYDDISEIPDGSKYDRIISIATFEHIINLPDVIAAAGRLLKDDGRLAVSIPNEGRFLWKFGYKNTSGREFKKKYGLDYEVIMRHEHVNSADEILLRYYFENVQQKLFGISKDFSFYRFYLCENFVQNHVQEY